MSDYAYENVRRHLYGDADTEEFWQFIPMCEKCGRFVKADENVFVDGLGYLKDQPNATCKKCGRVKMLCEGTFSSEELKI